MKEIKKYLDRIENNVIELDKKYHNGDLEDLQIYWKLILSYVRFIREDLKLGDENE